MLKIIVIRSSITEPYIFNQNNNKAPRRLVGHVPNVHEGNALWVCYHSKKTKLSSQYVN